MTEQTVELQKWRPRLGAAGQAHLETLRQEFGPQISFVRQLRTALGLTQTELADILDMTQGAVSKIERRDDPSLSTLAKMASAHGKRLRIVVENAGGDETLSLAVPVPVPVPVSG